LTLHCFLYTLYIRSEFYWFDQFSISDSIIVYVCQGTLEEKKKQQPEKGSLI
jgi:hypothetical protein